MLSRLPLLFFLSILLVSCAASIKPEASPSEKVSEAKSLLARGHYSEARDSLDGLETLTAGTSLGGDVKFILGETNFKLGKYIEAVSYFESYGSTYPDGPHASEALYKMGLAKVREIQKTVFYFFGIKKIIPADRDIRPIREARLLFLKYLDRFPNGDHAGEASRLAGILLEKEGLHELGIASFYLKKGETGAAKSRASAIMEGDYSSDTKDRAALIIREAGAGDNKDKPGKD